MNRPTTALGLILPLLGMQACSMGPGNANPVVGAWFVKEINAPFPYHMYVFNGDGTMQQANPDTFAGTETARSYDVKGVLTDGPTAPGRFEGQRVTYP